MNYTIHEVIHVCNFNEPELLWWNLDDRLSSLSSHIYFCEWINESSHGTAKYVLFIERISPLTWPAEQSSLTLSFIWTSAAAHLNLFGFTLSAIFQWSECSDVQLWSLEWYLRIYTHFNYSKWPYMGIWQIKWKPCHLKWQTKLYFKIDRQAHTVKGL